MSYLVAYVKFPGAQKDYPTECFRTDLRVKDTVLVSLRDGKLRPATVTRIEYLDWDCGATLLCKTSEAVRSTEGLLPPKGTPTTIGLATFEALRDELVARGWIPLRPTNHVHFVILTRSNRDTTANIYLRRRGVDLQIFTQRRKTLPKPYSHNDYSISTGRVVRHFLSQTSFNLYEGIERFASAFERSEGDYEKYFKPVGSRDRRTADLPVSCQDASEGFDAMLYDALGGDGGSVYIGDGLYMDSSGDWHD